MTSDEVDRPYRISTHDRCADPCPEFRDRVRDSDLFENAGQWGPWIETQDGERLAEGHEAVDRFLDEHL